MHLPPLLVERPFGLQVVIAIAVPSLFGLVTGLALSWNEIAYLILAVPIGLLGGFFAGIEHRGAEEGLLRGVIGGLLFGSCILYGLEIANAEPKANIGDPQAGLVFVTTFFGAIMGALGGRYRLRKERQLETSGRLVAE
ncbi:MAG TPA: hypothetical protein VGF25_20445 [Thermoleophilaceae bacterium]